MSANKFIIKLAEMIKLYPHIITWSNDGKEIEILDVQRFSKQVHPNYFTSSNYQSFLRQLNMYNFRKMSKRKNSVTFTHPFFWKGNQTQFQNIKRRSQNNSNKRNLQIQHSINLSDSLKTTFSPKIVSELQVKQIFIQLKKEVSDNGFSLVCKLQELLDRSYLGTLTSKMEEKKKEVKFNEYTSFCKFYEPNIKESQFLLANYSQYNLQSNIFAQEMYLQQ